MHIEGVTIVILEKVKLRKEETLTSKVKLEITITNNNNETIQNSYRKSNTIPKSKQYKS